MQRGAARAAVLGVNDGLVSTLCIVLAVAGAGGSPYAVMIAGFAGLIAGAISMATGEWISVKSQVDLFEGILDDLKKMVVRDRELLRDQVRDNLLEAGMNKNTATLGAADIAEFDEKLFNMHASRVIGLNPDELGSPWSAAGSSFALFTIGAFAPLLPWLFGGGTVIITASIAATLLVGVVVGGYVARTSGKSIVYGATRQSLIIVLAAAVTYGVGYLFGVSTR